MSLPLPTHAAATQLYNTLHPSHTPPTPPPPRCSTQLLCSSHLLTRPSYASPTPVTMQPPLPRCSTPLLRRWNTAPTLLHAPPTFLPRPSHAPPTPLSSSLYAPCHTTPLCFTLQSHTHPFLRCSMPSCPSHAAPRRSHALGTDIFVAKSKEASLRVRMERV